MLIEAALLTPWAWWLSYGLAAFALAFAASAAPWRSWLADTERRAVWVASLAILAAVWSLHANFVPGLSQRFLLITAVTLLHGWALTIVGATGVLAVLCLLGVADWASFGPDLLCTAIVPALFAARLHESVHRRLPRNYFVYFFVSVFLGSALAWNIAALTRAGLLALSGQPALTAEHAEDYLALLPLMSFGEAFMNGLIMATAVVFRPEWVMSFNDRAYLWRR